MSETAAALLAQGRSQQAAGQRDAAMQTFQRAILAAPDDPTCYAHLGELLYVGGFDAEARGIYDIGLRRLPASPLLNWARCMLTLPMVAADQSEAAAAREAFAERLLGLRAICFADGGALREAQRAVGFRSPLFLPCLGDVDPALMAAYGQLVADIMAANDPARGVAPRVRWRQGEKIRVGFVSGLFLWHAAWRMPTRGWVANLDRSRFTLIGYHTRDEQDEETRRAAPMFDRFHSGLTPLRLWLNRITADAPHVLIYPELGSDQTSQQLAALPLAPLQCTTWGRPATAGLPTVRYFLSADAMEPPDAGPQYTETLVRLPGLGTALDPDTTFWGNRPPEGDAWAGFGLAAESFRILCGQAPQTYSPEHDSVFPRIAQALPTARFAFLFQTERARDILWRRLFLAFQAQGVNAETHCLFVPTAGRAATVALIRDAHINLDVIGWSGCETALDAVAHGTPTVTLPGATMRSRQAAAILTMMGVTDGIARSVPDMIDKVVALGRDPTERTLLGDRLHHARARLFGDLTPVRALETFLTTEVARRCADT